MRSSRLAVVVAVSLATVAPAVAWQRFSKQDSDRFQSKLTRIVDFGNERRARGAAAAQSTPISDAELNAYFEYGAKSQIPTGIAEPQLNALGEGRVSGRALVDLDAVRTQKQRGWLDPIRGSLPLTATGLLITKDGVGRFQLESAQVSGISVPKSLLQELLGYYSRTPENPKGISMDDPFELPARIREIQVERGQATIVQ